MPFEVDDVEPRKLGFDESQFQDFVCAHGYGEATAEGLKLGESLMLEGDDLATAAAEVVARGLTSEILSG